MFRIVLGVLILISGSGFCELVTPSIRNELLGARSAGLSGSVIVTGSGTDAIFHNPAGTIMRQNMQACFGLMHMDFDRSVSWAGVLIPWKSSSFSLSWGSHAVSDIHLRSEDGSLIGSDDWRQHRVGLGFARKMNFLTSYGIDVHYYGESVPDNDMNGFGVDLGVVRQVLPPLLSLGISVHDAFGMLHYDGSDIWRRIRPLAIGGIAIGLVEGKIKIEYNLTKRIGVDTWSNHIGLDIRASKGMWLRSGYQGDGISVGFSISWEQAGFSYAGVPDPLGKHVSCVEGIWTR